MNADRDQDHCDDILDFEFLVKQKSGEDDAQDRDQGIVDGNLADGVAGQQRVVDGEAYCGDGNQAEKDEVPFAVNTQAVRGRKTSAVSSRSAPPICML